jgi:hypothetical protein
VQAIGANNIIEPAQTCIFQLDPHIVRLLFDRDDLVVEKSFGMPFDSLEQQLREIASPQRDRTR